MSWRDRLPRSDVSLSEKTSDARAIGTNGAIGIEVFSVKLADDEMLGIGLLDDDATRNEIDRVVNSTDTADRFQTRDYQVSDQTVNNAGSANRVQTSFLGENTYAANCAKSANRSSAEGVVGIRAEHEAAAVPQSQTQLWDAEEWRSYYEEQAAIAEFEGGWQRDVAERRAWRQAANLWWFELGTRFPPHVCAGCGKPVSRSNAIPLPHDQRVHDNACMTHFGRRWISEAADALANMGIPTPERIMPADAP